MEVKWKIKKLLDKHGKTPYSLWQASGLSKSVIYQMVNDETDMVRFDALAKLLSGLEELTGKRFEVGDLLEVVR